MLNYQGSRHPTDHQLAGRRYHPVKIRIGSMIAALLLAATTSAAATVQAGEAHLHVAHRVVLVGLLATEFARQHPSSWHRSSSLTMGQRRAFMDVDRERVLAELPPACRAGFEPRAD